MNRIFILFVAMCSALLFTGCNDKDLDNTANEIQDGLCEVSLNPIGEIITTDEPLSKSSIIMTDDIYIVQVYNTTSSTEESFAYGYFDNLQSMKLFLKKGNTYRIILSVIKNGKNLLGDDFCLTQNSIYSNYSINAYSLTDLYKNRKEYWFPLNTFYYNLDGTKLTYYSGNSSTSLSTSTINSGSKYSNFYLPYISTTCFRGIPYPVCDDWFYGEEVYYVPTGDYQTLDMDLKRVGFKLKYELSGVTDGEVTVKVYNSSRTFIDNTTNTSSYESGEQFIAFDDAKSAWEYADDYSENMTVSVSWRRSIGVNQDLGTKTIQVKRNCLNNIRITLGSDDKGAGLSLNIEEDSTYGGSSTTDIPVE